MGAGWKEENIKLPVIENSHRDVKYNRGNTVDNIIITMDGAR